MAVTNYLKNVTKSLAFVAADITKDMMPDVVDFSKSNTDFVKQTYSSIKLPSVASRRRMTGYAASKVFQPIDYGLKNIKEDLRTGDFYAKARADEDLLKMSGFDLGDDFDFDLDNWELDTKISTEANSVTKGDTMVVKAIEGSNAAVAQATVQAIVATSENSSKNLRANAAMLFEQNERIFGGMHQDLSAIGATLTSIFKLQSTVLGNLDKNISAYQTESLRLENERNAILKEMLEIQRDQRKTAQDLESARNRSSKKKRFSDFAIGGFVDLDKYFEYVKDNIKSDLSMFTGGGNISDTLSTMMVTPTRDMMKFVTKQLIPSTLKKSMESFNDTIGGVFANIIARVNKAGKNGGFFGGLLSRYFGISDKVNRKIDTGNYEKGAVAWDGIARKALTNVIPGYLMRIEAILSGNDPQAYDYNSGKWKPLSDAKAQLKKIKKNAVNTATYDLMQGMNSTLEKNAPAGIQARAEYNQAIDEFRQYLYDVNGLFYVYDDKNRLVSAADNGITAQAYPMLYKYYTKIRDSYRDFDIVERLDRNGNPIGKRHRYGTKMQFTGKIYEAKQSEDQSFRRQETNGTSLIAQLSEYNGKILDERRGGTLGILGAKDKFGHTIHSYLHNINQELMFWRVNFGESGFGGSSSDDNRPKRSFKSLNGRMFTAEQQQLNAARRRAQQQNQSGADPGAYRYNVLNAILEGRVTDLRDFKDNKSLEYLMHLAQDTDRIKGAYRDQMGMDMDETTQAIFNNFFKKQFKNANIRNMDDLQRAIDKAYSTGKNTYESLTQEEQNQLSGILGKLRGGKDFLHSLVYAPAEALSGVIMTADKTVYDMFFKRRTKEGGTQYQGFFDMLVGKTSEVFNKLKDKIIKDFIDPLRERLGLGGDFGKRFKNEAKNLFVGAGSAILNANKSAWAMPLMNRAMASKPGQRIISGLSTEDFNKLNPTQRKRYRDDMLRAGYSGDEALANRMETVGFRGSIQQKVDKLVSLGIDPNKIQAAIDHAKDEQAAHIALNKIYQRFDIKRHARGSRGYTGNTMLSEGELLINDSGVSVVQNTGAYRISKPTQILNSRDSYDVLSTLGYPVPKSRKSVQRDEALENIEKRKQFGNHASGTLNLNDVFNRGVNASDVKTMITEGKKWLPETLAGGAIGGIGALLLGTLGGPLVGAAVGSGINLIRKSKTVQDVLFGRMDEETGERKNTGIISKAVQDTVKKYVPSIAKGSLVGLTASLVTPLGPVGGLVLGGAISYLKKNEEMRERVFGKLGVGEDEKGIIRKMLPNTLKGAGIGAVATLFGGPFGILGNAAVGAAIGMVTSTDEFKDAVLGRTVNGIRSGGVVGVIKEAFEPLREAGREFKDAIFGTINKNIIQPIADFVQPAVHALPQLAAWIPRRINDIISKQFKKGSDVIINKLLIEPLQKLMKPVTKIAGKAFGIATTPFKLVGKAGDAIRRRQMSTMNAEYMTADERIAWNVEHGREGQKYDKYFASIGSDEFSIDKAKGIRSDLSAIIDTQDELRRSRDKANRDVNKILKNYRTADGKRLSGKAREEIAKAINNGRQGDIPKILARYKLVGSDVGMTDEQIKVLMGEEGLTESIGIFDDLNSRYIRSTNLGEDDRKSARSAVRKAFEGSGLEGVDLTNRSEVEKLIRYFDTEIKAKDTHVVANGDEPIDFLADNHENIETITKKITNIADTLNNIANAETKSTWVPAEGWNSTIEAHADEAQNKVKDYMGETWNELSQEEQKSFRGATKKKPISAKKAKRLFSIKNTLTNTKIQFTDGAKNFLLHNTSDYNYNAIRKFLSNEYIGAIVVASGRKVSVDDVKYYLTLIPSVKKVQNRCKAVVNNNALDRYSSIKRVMSMSGAEFAMLGKEAAPGAEEEQTEPDHNFLGLGILGSIAKSLFGKKKEDEESGAPSGIKKLGGSIASLFGAGNANIKAANGISDTNEVDKPGDGRDVAAIGDGFGLIKRKADGSIEPDTSDSHTKQLVNEQNKRQTLLEKLQNAQLKAAEAMSGAFQNGKQKAKKGLGWLAALLLGGALLKSGLAQKLFDGVIKPIWTDNISPWIKDKALPFLKDEVLKPAGDWIINTGLPAAGKWIFNVGIPKLAGLIGGAISYAISNLPTLLEETIKRLLGIGDEIVNNPKNVGAKTKINPKDRTGMSGLVDRNGNTLTWEDIAAGNYDSIYNAEGVKGTVNKKGEVVFKDASSKGSSYASVIGNAAAHSFVSPVGRLAGAAINKPFSAIGNALSKKGLVGKYAGGLFKMTGSALSKPISAAGNLGKATFDRAKRLNASFAEYLGRDVSEATARRSAKGYATALGNAGKTDKTANPIVTKSKELIDKVVAKSRELVTKLMEHPKVGAKLSAIIESNFIQNGVSKIKSVPELKTKIINLFDDIILKGASKASPKLLKQVIKHLGPVVTVAFLVIDFLKGCDQAESIFGVEQTGPAEEVCAGLVNALGNFLIIPAIWPGIPGLAQKLHETIGGGEDYQQRVAEADKAYNEYIQNTGSTLTKEEYLARQHSLTGKIGGKIADGWQGLKNKFGNLKEKISTGFKNVPKEALKAKAGVGLFDDLINSKKKDLADPENNSIPARIYKAATAIPNKILDVGKSIKEKFNSIIGRMTGSADAGESLEKDVDEGKLSVFSAEYWTSIIPKDNTVGGVLSAVGTGINRIMMAPIYLVRDAAKAVINGIKNIGGWLSTAFAGISDFFNDPLTFIYRKLTGQDTGDSSRENKYVNEKGKINSTGESASTSALKSAVNKAGSLLTGNTSGKVTTRSMGGTSTSKNNNKNKKNSGSSGISGFFSNAWKGVKSIFGLGEGPVIPQYSKQIDPEISGIRYNVGADHTYQTIGDSACGPAAAVNVMESLYGRGNPVADAANFALSHGYKETDGGTKPEFFTDYFARNGVSSSISYNRKQIENSINSGVPTVLMGSDSRGTSNSHPFGRNPHYVTVTGTDSRGNAIVQDPESNYSNQIYKVNDLVRKTTLGVSAFGRGRVTRSGRGRFGRGRYGRGKSKMILLGDSKTVGMYISVYGGGNKNELSGVTDKDGNIWICKVGAGYSYAASHMSTINNKASSDYAVVVIMGVNDIMQGTDGPANSYATLITNNAKNWTAKGAEVYYISIPPIDGVYSNRYGKITNEKIDAFNSKLRSGLGSNVKYIDINSQLKGNVKCPTDHLHYDGATYKKVYELIRQSVGAGAGVAGSASTSGATVSSGTTAAATTTAVDTRNMLLFEAKYKKDTEGYEDYTGQNVVTSNLSSGMGKYGRAKAYSVLTPPESMITKNFTSNMSAMIKKYGKGRYGRGDIEKQDLGVWAEVTAEELNAFISSYRKEPAPFHGKGEVFVQAGQITGLDPVYILAHSAIESNWGASNFAKNRGNYFGIGAFDSNPSNAYTMSSSSGDFHPDGLLEGAKWIKKNYYDRGQTSLYLFNHGPKGHNYRTSNFNPEVSIMSKCYSSISGYDSRPKTRHAGTGGDLTVSGDSSGTTTTAAATTTTAVDTRNMLLFEAKYKKDTEGYDDYSGYRVVASNLGTDNLEGVSLNKISGSVSTVTTPTTSDTGDNGQTTPETALGALFGRSAVGGNNVTQIQLQRQLEIQKYKQNPLAKNYNRNRDIYKPASKKEIGQKIQARNTAKSDKDFNNKILKATRPNKIEYPNKAITHYNYTLNDLGVRTLINDDNTPYEKVENPRENTLYVNNYGYNEELHAPAVYKDKYQIFTPDMMAKTDKFIAQAAMGTLSKILGPSRFGKAKSSIGEFLGNVVANSAAAQVYNSILDFGISSYDDSDDSSGQTTVAALPTSSRSGAVGTGDAAAMVKVAQQEVALTDGSNQENPMGSNRVKYNDWYYGSNVSGSAYPWCAAFVAWVANQAGVSTDILPKSASTKATYDNVGSHGGSYPSTTEAQPGDLTLFTRNGSKSGIYHIGIVESNDGSKIHTIEGNTTNAVHRRNYSIPSNNVLIARPAYSSSNPKASGSTTTTSTDTSSTETSGSGGNGIKPRSRFGMAKYGMGNRAAEVWNWFTSHGYSDAATAGILGNMQQESGVDPEVIQGGGRGPAAGIVQWENYNTKSARWKSMADHAKSKGKPWTDLESQLEYVDKENNSSAVYWRNATTYKSYDAFKQATDIDKATLDFEKAFERAGKPAMENRYKAAHKYYEQFNGTGGTAISSDGSTTTTGTVTAGPQMSSIGQWLGNVLANSRIGQVVNSFLDVGGSSQVAQQASTDTGSAITDTGDNTGIGVGNNGNSALVSVVKLSPNNSGQRKHAVDTITIHTMAGNMGAEQCCQFFITGRHDASCNYTIGGDGKIGLCVEEKNVSWCSSSRENDNRAITFEVASTTSSEPYKCTDAAMQSIINLCADICIRYGKDTMIWIPNKAQTMARQYANNEMRMTVHRWFKNKSCPGNYLYGKMGEIAEKVNAKIKAIKASNGTNSNATQDPKTTLNGMIADGFKQSKPTGSQVVGAVMDNLAAGFTAKGGNGFKPRSMYGSYGGGILPLYGMGSESFTGLNINSKDMRKINEFHSGNHGSEYGTGSSYSYNRINYYTKYGSGSYSMPKTEADKSTINAYRSYKDRIYDHRAGSYTYGTGTTDLSGSPSALFNYNTNLSKSPGSLFNYTTDISGKPKPLFSYPGVDYDIGDGGYIIQKPISYISNRNDYSNIFKQIIRILLSVANNTDKLNTIVAILNEKLNINITPQDVANAQKGNSTSEALAAAIANSTVNNTSKLNTYADTVSDNSIYNIISAMNAIASE